MKWLYNKIGLLVVAILLLNGLIFNFAQATSTGNITVQATVPSVCVGPCGHIDNPPTISNVSSSATYTTATVSWSASDAEGPLKTVNFQYGTTNVYGQSASISGNYFVDLSNLTTSTQYYFKIIVTDSGNQAFSIAGTFQTNSVPDTTGPIISNIVVTPSLNGAVITFSTNENAVSQINYGLTTSLLGTALEGASANISHSLDLLGLSSGKKYYFQITATDGAGNSTQSSILNFNTVSDTTPPPQIIGLTIQTTLSSFILTWQNPLINFNPDFSGVKILRKIGSAATDPNDNLGIQVYKGTGETLTDTNVTPGVTYFYTVFTFDDSLNYSDGVSVSGKINIIVTPEICNNGIDDNANGFVDCLDPECLSSSACEIVVVTSTSSTLPVTFACSDGVDNDGDGLIDFPVDPGCTSAHDNDEYNPPTITVSDFQKITLDKIKFYSGARQIEIIPQQNTVTGLSGSNLSLSIRKSDLASTPVSLILHIGEAEKHIFVLDNVGNIYYSDVLFPISGISQAFVEVDYGAGQFDSIAINLKAADFGKVIDDNGANLSGVEIKLFKENGTLFLASIFGQINPQITNGSASYGWMVPNGKYYLTATKDKYYSYQSEIFEIKNNIVNNALSLVKIPPKLLDDINPNDSVIVNTGKVIGNLAAKAKATGVIFAQDVQKAARALNEITSDPVVQQVANQVVAPTAVGVAAASTLVFMSWADILPLLRFLFLQPLMLIGRGKREKWGTIYNSLSKLPIDLAMVRLINVETGKLVQTKVTGADGRYFFIVNTGRYRVEVRKNNLIFPTILLKDLQIDGKKLDIYHGEEIKVTAAGAVLTANIPLDPVGEKMLTPKRVVWNRILRRIQSAVGWIGLIVTLVSLYISPVWYVWLLLAAHLFFTFIFKRLSKPLAAKGWGIVYDEGGKKPLSKVVARLFDSKFNKLVATEVTDNNGRYYFMAGDNQYYISFDRDGYESMKTLDIDLRGKAAETIAQDVKLKKK